MSIIRTCVLFILFAPFFASANDVAFFEGTVTTIDGNTTEGMLFSLAKVGSSKNEPLKSKIRLKLKNRAGETQYYDVKTTDIEKIIYSGLDLGKSGGHRDYGSYHKTSQVVVLKNGKRIKQESSPALLMPYNSIYISSQHPITGELTYDRVYWSKVKEIILGSNSGQIRVDSQNRSFPADYTFSPYTGEKMKLMKVGDGF